MKDMKIGDVVKDKVTHQYGIIINKYKGSNHFDWEIFALKDKFVHGHVWQDCRKEKDLSLRSYEEYAKSLITDDVFTEIILDLSFIKKIKLLFMKVKKK